MRRTQTPEQALQSLILAWLAAEHILAFRMNTGAMVSESQGRKRFTRFGVKGMADILAFQDSGPCVSSPVWLELKSEAGRQTPEQKSFQSQVEEHGHLYRVVRSLEEVEMIFKKRLQ